MEDDKGLDAGRRRRIGLGSGRNRFFCSNCSKSNENPSCLHECRAVCMKSTHVRMNFVRLIHKVFEMYASRVGWQLPASISADWSPLSADGYGGKFAGRRWRCPKNVSSRDTISAASIIV